jgi:hypothetical protein
MARKTPGGAPSFVYFIRPIGMKGPVKIGCSLSPDGRRETLETWAPFPLEVVASIPGSQELERRFHALLKDFHSHREWFHWCPALEEIIQAVANGIFPVEMLPAPQRADHLTKRKPWTEEQKANWRARRERGDWCAMPSRKGGPVQRQVA